jgi:hypothetical protein
MALANKNTLVPRLRCRMVSTDWTRQERAAMSIATACLVPNYHVRWLWETVTLTKVTMQYGVHGLDQAGEGGHEQELILLSRAHHKEAQV